MERRTTIIASGHIRSGHTPCSFLSQHETVKEAHTWILNKIASSLTMLPVVQSRREHTDKTLLVAISKAVDIPLKRIAFCDDSTGVFYGLPMSYNPDRFVLFGQKDEGKAEYGMKDGMKDGIKGDKADGGMDGGRVDGGMDIDTAPRLYCVWHKSCTSMQMTIYLSKVKSLFIQLRVDSKIPLSDCSGRTKFPESFRFE